MDDRPPIPADIRRRVLVEAGHRCAIPTCRYIEVDVHHVIPWAQCQAHEYDNLLALCPNCHRRADRGEIDRKSLRLYKLNLRFIHDKYSQLEIDVLFDLFRIPPGQGIQWPVAMLILLKRILDSGFLHIHTAHGSISSFGMDLTPRILTLTDKGRSYITELGLHEL
jgi:hypothetical protein